MGRRAEPAVEIEMDYRCGCRSHDHGVTVMVTCEDSEGVTLMVTCEDSEGVAALAPSLEA